MTLKIYYPLFYFNKYYYYSLIKKLKPYKLFI